MQLIEVLEKATPLIFTAIAVAIIFAVWKWVIKLPARIQKRWYATTGLRGTGWSTYDGEKGGYFRCAKNWRCAILLFLGFDHPSLWEETKY